jgi:Ser/Thr protein kinase RdoA (MazF antagonist)
VNHDAAADLYSRPSPGEQAVQAVLAQLGVDSAPADLGGTMSLNLHLEELGQVLRVHGRFEQESRIRALRDLRRRLDGQGLTVGVPLPLLGEEIISLDGRVAELETFVEAKKPAPTWDSYVWMYDSIGRLHHAIERGAARLDLPVPEVATYATPEELRAVIHQTALAVSDDVHAAAIAARVREMIEALERQWISPENLPQQLVHGDIRLGNVAQTATDVAYFDFGFAARRPRIHDLAHSLFWIVLKPDDSGRAETFNWARAEELIAAYEAAAQTTILDLERRALAPLLAAIPMYLAAIASHTPDPSHRIKQEIRSLEIARWVLDQDGELFR